MWMQYSTEQPIKAEDLGTAIERLSSELYALYTNSLHAANYDMGFYFNNDAELMYDAEKYRLGVILCDRYTYGIICLDEFCEEIVTLSLKHFLYGIAKYLPVEIIQKYQLHQDNNSHEEVEDVSSGNDIIANN